MDVLADDVCEAHPSFEVVPFHRLSHNYLSAREDYFCLDDLGEARVVDIGWHLDLESLEATILSLLEKQAGAAQEMFVRESKHDSEILSVASKFVARWTQARILNVLPFAFVRCLLLGNVKVLEGALKILCKSVDSALVSLANLH